MENSDSKGTLEAVVSSSGWPIVSLDEICSIASGITKGRKAPPEHLREVPYMAVANVQDGRLNLDAVKTIQASSTEIERYRLLSGDLLLTEGGDPDKLGRGTVWNGEINDCIHQNHIFRVRASSSLINMSFLSRLVASPAGKAYFLSKAKQTTGIASINLTQLRNFPVPLAPLNEQRRIAAKLDTTLAAVDACRQRLDGVEALLKRFRQAVLAAATSGELTREWREGKIEARNAWEQITLMQAIKRESAITYGVIKLGVEVSDGVPCLRTSNVRWLQIESDDVKRISPSISANYSRTVLAGGEVLVNVRGSLGGVAVVDTLMRGWNVSREIAVVPVDEARFIPEFLAFYIGSQKGQRWLAGVEKGVAYTGINLEDLRTLPVSRPTLEEQQEIVRRTQELFSLADQLEARLTAARKTVERLTPALLAKAFRGELVPQDPGDEPASALLERIRAARQAEAAASGPSRRGRRPAPANPAPSPVDAAPVTPDRLANLLRECGALSARALLAASELDPVSFQAQLAHERSLGTIGHVVDDDQELLEAVG